MKLVEIKDVRVGQIWQDRDGDLIGDFEYAYDEFIKIARKALNGESEE